MSYVQPGQPAPPMQPQIATRKKGRPVLGAISGIFLGLGLAILAQQYAILPLDTLTLFGLPGGLLVFGLILGLIPRGGGKPKGDGVVIAEAPPVSQPYQGPDAVFCTSCGMAIEPGLVFCTSCGAPLAGG